MRNCFQHCVARATAAVMASLLLVVAGPAHAMATEEPSALAALTEEAAGEQQADEVPEAQVPSPQDVPQTEAGGTEAPVEGDGQAVPTDETDEQAPEAATYMHVSVSYVAGGSVWAGPDALSLEEGMSAWDATELSLSRLGLDYTAGASGSSDVLASLTSAVDGQALALDAATGSAWHLYLNGERYQGSASLCALADGDVVEWRYDVATIMVSVSVIGPGGTGANYWIAPTRLRVASGQSAWDASKAVLAENGYTEEAGMLYYAVDGTGAITLGSISTLAENGITGESWELFVNGAPADRDAAHTTLRAGDSICWYYVGRGVSELPSFAARTGAATQSPAESVRVSGPVTQAWCEPVSGKPSLRSVLDAATGVCAQGTEDRAVLLSADKSVLKPFSQLACGTWDQSLSNLLDAKIRTGSGGRASMGLDGSVYYLDDAGTVIKLELR